MRVARYGARAPIAEDRLRYHAGRAEVELVSDAGSGPYVGVHRLGALGMAGWTTGALRSLVSTARSFWLMVD